MTAPVLKLPDIHERWPFPVLHNPWQDIVGAESLSWMESLSIMSGSQMKKFRAANFDILASMAYAHMTDMHHFRVACDLLLVLFAFDDATDEQSGQEARRTAEISLDALRDWKTPRSQGEHPAGEMHRSFSERLSLVASPKVVDRFIASYEMYVTSVAKEAHDRDTIRPSLHSYLEMRRNTGAMKPSFDILLIPHEIPDDILNDPRLIHVETLGRDLVCIANDIFSFNVEQARGDIHNAVIVVMHERGLSMQQAMDFVGTWYRDTIEELWTAMRDVPLCGSIAIRNRVKMYFAAIANWVTGNHEWSLDCDRYFPMGRGSVESGMIVPLPRREL
ncbi:Terpene cyclase [Mycena venus]|uniref:Terpene synthase n=1 Tax=Mycena venus TaxID=2733690 RepID=A0A8H6TZV4_9AGAR|nr:Terpene cyclase [Mycena venus]